MADRFELFAVENPGPFEGVVREALAAIERRGLGRDVAKILPVVLEKIRNGEFVLALIVDRQRWKNGHHVTEAVAGLCTLEIREGYVGEKLCRLGFLYTRHGYRPREAWAALLPKLDGWAKARGCQAVEFVTRRAAWGVQRLLRGTGFVESRVVFTRTVRP